MWAAGDLLQIVWGLEEVCTCVVYRHLVSSRCACHAIFLKNDSPFIHVSIRFVISDGKIAGVLTTEGDLWRNQRRFTLHVLRNFGMGRTIIEDIVGIGHEQP